MTFQPVFQLSERRLELWRRTFIMGILNITPDSFSDGGLHLDCDRAVQRGLEMAAQGADILDLGGESTRPGADPISVETELKRVLPVLTALKQKTDLPISVDTYKSTVAEAVLKAGAEIINDISGFHFDHQMPAIVQKYNAAAVLMHIKGQPKNMQQNPHYDDLLAEVMSYLNEGIKMAESSGISRDRLVIDPGIGFGKRLKDNYELIRELQIFNKLGCGILIGPSRKSFLGKVLNLPETDRLEATAAAVTGVIMTGADIVRVHDVMQMKRVVMITDAIVGKPDARQFLETNL